MSNNRKNTSSTQPHELTFQATAVRQAADAQLPDILQKSNRSGVAEIDPLLADIKVDKVYELISGARSGMESKEESLKPVKQELLAIEAEDGTTVFIRSDKLVEDIERIRPEAIVNGAVEFSRFRDPNATSRGAGEIFWKAVSVLKLPTDNLLEEARELAKEWAKDKLMGDMDAVVFDTKTALGVKALMWKIESRLAGNPGLYQWDSAEITAEDYCKPGDPRLNKAASGEPMLLLIHGTASYTLGSFSELRKDRETWKSLKKQFPGGIFGYEHRSFSQSPVENALEIVELLPRNANVSLLTHSRGGLIGDLLSLGQVNPAVIDAYEIDASELEDPEGLVWEAQEEQERLHALVKTLRERKIVIQRYVRVACPARGTRILSDNLDAALSDFLNLIQLGGSALMGVVAGTLGGPAAGTVFGEGASSALGVLKRLVLEIAGRRIDPRLIPGIAAMRIDSPLAGFLAHPETRRHDRTEMAVITGDTDFDGLGFSNFRRRIVNLFCDWRLFDQQDNDLVVDTDSMYAGLGFRDGASYLYDRDSTVTHFRYFENQLTRDALRDWLVEEDCSNLPMFAALNDGDKTPWRERDKQTAKRGITGPRPVVIVIPGIMGTHIEINRRTHDKPGSGNRIWFDFVSIAVGKLDKIADTRSEKILAEDLFESFYGDLVSHLQETHHVIRCPYDWRQPLEVCAKQLHEKILQAEEQQPGQPIRLLAHSMGGLVSRTLMEAHKNTWQKVVQSGGHLVMLGTPNHGSHQMVHTLLGKSDSMRKLATIDVTHNLQEVIDIICQLPGALSLLPRPTFEDSGSKTRSSIETSHYYKNSYWAELKDINKDRWFGRRIAGTPVDNVLKNTAAQWNKLGDTIPLHPECVSYVYGQGKKTACGVVKDANKLEFLFTPEGDGTVTWESGRLENLDAERCWYIPVDHGDLVKVEDYFPAIMELLDNQSTNLLQRLPRKRGVAADIFTLDAPPPVIPSEAELARAIMGSGPDRHRISRTKQQLKVSVKAGDLRFINKPLMCGHYIGDAISGAEAALDRVVNNQLSNRQRLGVYVSDVGTSSIAMVAPTSEEKRRKTRRGAIIVGLGELSGRLSSSEVTETVRAGILHLLLRSQEVPDDCGTGDLKICSLLIGQNSSANISISESLAAVVLGICEANARYNCNSSRVSEVEFVELYLDTAISATHAIKGLPERLAGELTRVNMQLQPVPELRMADGARHRLYASRNGGHWPRLIVTDADRTDEYCPPECYQSQHDSPIPEPVLEQLLGKDFRAKLEDRHDKTETRTPCPYPERLRYVLVAERARSESVALQRQPGLIESIVKLQVHQSRYNSKLSRTLFELMVPLDYKALTRETSRLVLQLDAYTANLPWELLQGDKHEPMAIRTAMVRQLTTTRFRRNVRNAPGQSACIIVDPSTEGFTDYFKNEKHNAVTSDTGNQGEINTGLPRLHKAVEEGTIIREQLRAAGYLDEDISYSPPDSESLDVMHHLLHRSHRILVIAAHGVFEARHRDGKLRSGVVLSGGALLTATEIGQMEVVPELVFLNCCHLGQITTDTAYNRLAYSISRELIEIGVRCIVAAGWAVDDAAACTFAETFFKEMLSNNERFGDAVFKARIKTYRQHRGSNTWGAYQAYGDPGYRLIANNKPPKSGEWSFSAIDELLHELAKIRLRQKEPGFKKTDVKTLTGELSELRQSVPAEWLERPDVLEAFGRLYADIASNGFAKAREYYLQAISSEDKLGIVAIKTIEQLANIEARAGEELGGRDGFNMIDLAIKRIEALRLVSSSTKPTRRNKATLNPERAGILGSAYKRQASVTLQLRTKQWSDVAKLLHKSASAYKEAEPADPATDPYTTLNSIQFACLAGDFDKDSKEKRMERITLTQLCAETARKKYAESASFFDAVMPADALVTAWLLGDQLNGNPVDVLTKSYKDGMEGVPANDRQMDSVTKNLRIIEKFLVAKKSTGAKVLEQVANKLDPKPDINNNPVGDARKTPVKRKKTTTGTTKRRSRKK